ncbi:SDR family NAD(P)-dependent oxidoreductase [Streptomyces venetus]|uniref:SDR family NAD(P)-dependent oxidoreductase n=1 Tax=Streptomyces venetus TaxID=1701086 RepID=UPI003C2FC1AF
MMTESGAIAVVGVGCRFPGGVRSLDSFGRLLIGAPDLFTEVPADRWGPEYADPAGGPGTVSNGVGAFLEDIDRFDAAFFGITPREADALDPQQRLVMEVAWEAMADSGRPREEWRGSRTAVVLGMLAKDYELLHARTLGLDRIGPHHVSGTEFSFAAGRLAYTFDLHGPVSTVNSACSSSLLAVHQAVQSLRTGDCDTALAGGVSLLITPDLSVFLSSVGALSPSGVCRPFDASADGIVRGEGCGVVVLKRYADAVAAGDRIHALIRGSAVNNDGASLGLTVPNAAAQGDLLRRALDRAGLAPHEVDYVEAHGTGTPIGDLIEVEALGEVYGTGRTAHSPVLVGSHKAVLGHMDAAAGIGGLLKTIWVVSSGRVPAQPRVERRNPAVDWRGGAVAVPLAEVDLSDRQRPPRAGVSSFGLSGTNVHVVVEAPPVPERAAAGSGTDPAASAPQGPPHVLLVSAAGEAALAEQVTRLRAAVAEDDAPLDDLVASAATRRTHEAYRYAVVADDRAGLVAALEDPLDPPEGAYAGVVEDPETAPSPVFVFSGQGGQWAGMAADLYDADRSVRETLDECAELIAAEGAWSLLDEIRRPEGTSRLAETEIVQPAIFSVQVALARWLRERGVTPGAIVGHSLGEVAAAHTAGALSLPDAVKVIVRRARLLGETAGTGLMYAVRGSEDRVRDALAGIGLPVTVVAVNGPESLVVAGETTAVKETAAALEARGLGCRLLRVDAAAHSPLVAHCGPPLEKALAEITAQAPVVPLVSTVDPEARDLTFDAAYWARNFTSPVLLWPAVDTMLAGDDHPLVEIGPHPVLVPPLADALRRRGRLSPALPVLNRDEPGPAAVHKALARLHVAGVPVRWERVTGRPRRYRSLPVPSWEGDRHWLPEVPRGRQSAPADGARASGGVPARIRLTLLDEDDRVTGELYAAPGDGVPVALPASEPGAVARPVPAAVAPTAPVPSGSATGSAADRVEALVREVLGLRDGHRLGRRRGLFEQGLDSLTAVTLRRRMEEDFGVELPTPIVFERPTVAALASYLSEVAPVPPAPDAASTAATTPATSAATPAALTAPAVGDAGTQEDAVAVIGVGCRLPAAASPDAFWRLLMERRDTASEPPPGRRADPLWDELGAAIPTRGSYVDGIADFDAPFFRISPREAKLLDPQQRMFLEVAWEALEDAGCPAHSLASRPVGVYAGISIADYQHLIARHLTVADLGLHHGTGTSYAAVAGRLSYVLGLSGPSFAVDTACSSSLTAVHLACQALRSGECEVAVVGGASAIVAPSPLMASMAGGGALSEDGRCKAFDQDADGFACGEGAVALILKPLRTAVADGDRVYAVLRGSALNQDGATGGLTVPNASAQVDVVRQALDRAGWSPADVDYVEAHGTGTPLGDPIEVRALAESLGAGRTPERPLLIGSAKANVGHLGAAAGIVGLLKVVLSLSAGELPPHLVDRPTSHIDWDRLPVALVDAPRKWPAEGRPARAGVSAFGFTGSNAHVLVEQFVPALAEPEPAPAAAPGTPPYVLPVTAATPAALRAAAALLADALRTGDHDVADVVFTARHRRSLLEHRAVVVGSDAAALAEALDEVAAGRTPPQARLGRAVEDEEPSVTLSYGTDLPPAGARRAFALAAPGHEAALTHCAAVVERLLGTPCDLTAEPPAELRDAFLLAHQYAATRGWYALGITPVAVVGTGTGRLAAACAAGQLSLEEALRQVLSGRSELPENSARPAGFPALLASDADPGTVVVDVLLGHAPPAHPGVHSDRPDLVAAELYAAGYRPTPQATPPGRRLVSLPGYPWEHRPYWYREFTPNRPVPWLLCGDTGDELRSTVERLLSFVGERPGTDVASVAGALAGRAALPQRLAVVGESADELVEGLESFLSGAPSKGVLEGSAKAASKVVFVFPGQGWQWVEMGVELLAASEVFARVVGECSAVVQELAGWSVLEVLRREPGAPGFDRVDVVQPVMFSVMVGLARLWESVGVVPSAVVGHSQGEIAAAHVAGVLSLEDAVRVVVARSRALVEICGQGSMASVALGCAEVQERIAGLESVSVAAVNGPASTVVSGGAEEIAALVAGLTASGVRARRIDVDYASHSVHVEQVRHRIEEALASVQPRAGRVPVYSTLRGEVLTGPEMDGRYWYANLRGRVEFEQAVRGLLADGFTTLVECSAHPVLTPGIGETVDTVPGAQVTVTGTLRRDDGGLRRFLTSTSTLWTAGVDVDWSSLLPEAEPVELPLDAPVTATGTVPDSGSDDRLERRFWRLVKDGQAEELAGLLGLRDDRATDALDQVLPALSHWWQQRREGTVAESWRYRITWDSAPRTPGTAVLSGSWLVVVPRHLADDELVVGSLKALTLHGADPVPLLVDTRDGDRESLAELLLRGADSPADGEVAGVLSFLPLDESPHAQHPAVPSGLLATVDLVRALDSAPFQARLWSVTCGAFSVTPDEVPAHPAQAHVWGLSRAAGLENPPLRAGMIDLPPTVEDHTAALLCGVLAGPGDEDQVAVRGTGVLLRRLKRAPLPDDAQPAPWRPEGTTLVTGGTGALGSHIARWLAYHGAPHLLLVSRTGENAPGAAELVAELEQLGSSVTLAACDAADRDALIRAVEGIPAEHPLTAVMHTAGIVDDAPVNELTAGRLERVLRPKSGAVAHLRELAAAHDLSAFVLFSSAGSLLPNVGQGAYAAGNAYLSALAANLRAEGIPALSVAWGAWSGGGMAGKEEFARFISHRGMDLMTPHLAATALQQALDHGDTDVMVANVDWARVGKHLNAIRPHPMVSELVGTGPVRATAAATEQPALPTRLSALTPQQRLDALLDLVCAEVSTVLGYARTERVAPDQAFRELGFDSVMGIELRNRLNKATGLRLSPTAIFDHPTSEALAQHLLDELVVEPAPFTEPDREPGSGAAATASQAARHEPPAASQIDSMSIEEMIRMARGDRPDPVGESE